MLMLSFYSLTVCISFKAKCILPQWQVKQSNLWKCISWKRKRLEIINKIEAKRASSATRELNVNTLRWSVQGQDDVGDEVISSPTLSAKTEILSSSCHFFEQKYSGYPGKSLKISPWCQFIRNTISAVPEETLCSINMCFR